MEIEIRIILDEDEGLPDEPIAMTIGKLSGMYIEGGDGGGEPMPEPEGEEPVTLRSIQTTDAA